MKRRICAIIIAVLISLASFSAAFGQNEELSLELSRDFGYGGFNGDIQGTFSILANGPENLERVQFYMDEIMFGEDSEAPFSVQFVTDKYPVGTHVFSAVGYTSDGRQITSQPISAKFISKKESGSGALKLIVPVLAVILCGMAFTSLSTVINSRKGKKLPAGAPRNYSFGGGICPKCKRPFGFPFFCVKLMGGTFTPCPHCGKWSFVSRSSLRDLHLAELAELQTSTNSSNSEEDALKKELDDSKYQNPWN